MLKNAKVSVTIGVADLEKEAEFYEGKLGLEGKKEDDGGITYECGGGTSIYLYPRGVPSKAEHTIASFEVEDMEKEVDALIEKGVVFEQYDMPDVGITTDEKGIATMGDLKVAWFKDPEGNILALGQK